MSTPDDTQRIPAGSADIASAETIRSEANDPSGQETNTIIQPEAIEDAMGTVRSEVDDKSKRKTQSYDQPNETKKNDDPIVGRTIDNYEVVGRLGKGGFGAVYKGRDVNLDRFAAIKLLHFALEGEYQDLFRREAKILANLSKHPSIVQIYNWGEFNNQNYMALEYLDGSVQDMLTGKPDGLGILEALRITLACAEALEYAHNEGVLHRDIKPANMLIDRKTNQTKLCDFGLAKYYNKGAETASGVIAGSPPYMPVEQIRGEKVDERADIYALGVSLYEMLSGKLPFEGNSQIEIMENVRERRGTPLPKRRPDLSKGVLAIVEKATAAKADDRFQNAGEFKDALAYALNQMERTGTVDSVPFKVAGKNSPAKIAGFAAAAAVILFAVFSLIGGSEDVPPTGGGTGAGTSSGVEKAQPALPAGLAQAKQELETGNYAGSQDAYNAWLAQNPADEDAQYGLAYAELFNGDLDLARETAGAIPTAGLKSELMAAITHSTDGDQAKAEIEQAAQESPTPYPVVMLASIDLGVEDYQSVISRLGNIDTNSLRFNWQRNEAQNALAQAYFNVGDFAMANTVFTALAASESASQKRIAEGYLKLLEQQTNTAYQEMVSQKVAAIREQMSNEAADREFDTWTSRPLRLWVVEPIVKEGARIPVQEGLAGIFSSWLGEQVMATEGVPLEVVERGLLAEILQEQELSSLSADDDNDRVQLGHVMGARLIVYPEFLYFGGDQLKVDVIDTETTRKIPVGRLDVPNPREPNFDWDIWMAEVAGKVREKIESGYPLRGEIAPANGGITLNIGEGVGVTEGMAFKVYMTPDHASEVSGGKVIAVSGIGADSAKVEIEGFSAEAVPADGWYVEEIQDIEPTAAAGE